MNTNINYKTIQKVLYWIIDMWFKQIPLSKIHSQIWLNQVEKWTIDNGTIWTIKHIKMIRLLVLSQLSDKPLKQVDQIIGINRSNGLPKCISYLHKDILSKDIKSIRYVLTLLSISRYLPGWVKPSLESIYTPSKANQSLIKDIDLYMADFLSDNKWTKNSLTSYFDRGQNILLSTKSGPNGRASTSALYDLASMPQILKNILMGTNIRYVMQEYEMLLSSSRVKMFWYVQESWKTYKLLISQGEVLTPSWFKKTFMPHKKGYTRKLSIVKDPEAKSRVIAILDYWSQSWLRQIHRIHFNFLRTLPNDRTFTQNPVITNKPSGHKYYSFDLSSATDRFPIDLQRRLMGYMFDKGIATQWELILTSEPFYVPWLDKYVTYNAGQPMGAYASWSTFTISHHMVLYYIHRKLNLNENYYIILGDDIVIYHDEVASSYLEIMKDLDVNISIPKTHISSKMYEFAKRIFIDGQEVTGIQLRGLLENKNKYHLIYQMLYELVYERGYIPSGMLTIPSMVKALCLSLNMKERHSKNIYSRTNLLHGFNKFLNGDKTLLEEILKSRYPNYEGQLELPPIEINNLIYLSMDKALSSTIIGYYSYAKDLFNKPLLVEQAAIGLADEADIWTSPIFYLSKFPVMEGLKNTISLLSRSVKTDTMKDLVKALALPDTNVFDKRSANSLSGAQAKLAKIFLAQFEHSVIEGKLTNMPLFSSNKTAIGHIQSTLITIKIDRTHGLIPPSPKIEPVITGIQAMW
jgi:hypothetical protein